MKLNISINKMSDNFKLIMILSTTKEYLNRSLNEGWPDEKTREAAFVIDGMINYLLDKTNFILPEYALLQFIPSGPIQEISMANNWHKEYLILAEEFDKLEYLLKA